MELISLAELHEIRRMWLYEKHEFQDSLPRIYEEVTGQAFPKPPSDDNLLRGEDWEILREVCGEDEEFFRLQTGLLDIEREFRGMSRRTGIYEALGARLRAGQFANEQEALAIRQDQENRREEATRTDPAQAVRPHTRQQTLFEESEVESV